MPGPGQLGGPGLPDRVRVTSGSLTSRAIVERDSFNRFIKTVERSDQQIMEKLTEDMARRARAKAPVRTGRLRKSIMPVILNNGREGRVTSNIPYAIFQEKGTNPHLIHGVKANFFYTGTGKGGLISGQRGGGKRFVWNDPKYQVRPRKKGYQNWTPEHGATVNHPGNRAAKFFEGAFKEVWPTARTVMHSIYKRNS